MIWFGSVSENSSLEVPAGTTPGTEAIRMERALRVVAASAPHLTGAALTDALTATGWVDRETVARMLPCFRHFDADRFFAENLRSISFRGEEVAPQFRAGIRRAVADLVGGAEAAQVGVAPCIRFRDGEREGIVLAYPEVHFSLGGNARDAVAAAAEEMPDALVVIARNFGAATEEQLRGMLWGSEVPGTLLTVNLLLGMRATVLRYQPRAERVMELLGAGRALRSVDVARLGNRV